MIERDPSAEPQGSPEAFEHWGTLSVILFPVSALAHVVFWNAQPIPSSGYGLAFLVFAGLMLLQVGSAAAACRAALRRRRQSRGARGSGAVVGSILLGLFGFIFSLGGLFVVMLSGAGWGRPLRIRGRLRHPELTSGADWSRGDRPDITGLDAATCRALEALWLHDAQKEHASVPAFTRISWMLSAAGAPPRLLEGAHRSALQEADHACRCFALAAGYGGRSHTVEPMPDLLLAGLELRGPVLEVMAEESLKDGCLLEDFNADVAAACASVCRDPATAGVLARIAREEREHAEFSWELLEWTLSHGGAPVAHAVSRAIPALARIPRPTATSRLTQPLVAQANAALLEAHGRIADGRWAELWTLRLAATIERASRLGASERSPARARAAAA